MHERDINVLRLRAQLTYHPLSGLFTWRQAKGRQPAGATAGGPTGSGYVGLRLDGVRYLAHRLAWLYVMGQTADGEIDHIDGDRTNNRISNLRAVTRSVNQQNQRKAQCSNKTGLLGVSSSEGLRYRARIHASGKSIHIGTFATPDAAHAAYLSRKRCLHEGNTL